MINLKNILNKSDSQFATWRMLNIVISGILLAVLIFFIFFIYRNINTALINTATALEIKSKTTFDTLDLKKYDAARLIIENKKNLPTINQSMRNMFNYETPTTTTNSSATQ